MTRTLITIIILQLGIGLLHAQQTLEDHIITKNHVTFVYVEQDTFVVINSYKSIKSYQYQSEISASFLLQQVNGKLDTLFVAKPNITDFNTPTLTIDTTFDISSVTHNLLHGNHVTDEEDTKSHFIAITDIKHVTHGLFEMEKSEWSYTGGARGYGQSVFKHYNALTQEWVTFEMLFKPSIFPFIQSYLPDEDGLQISCDNFSVHEDQVIFSVLYQDKLDHYLPLIEIPVLKLKNHLVKKTPLWAWYEQTRNNKK